ncbi:MAG: hypothetical protein MUC89_05365 [Acetobacteraceae bacterium]|jgi:hypothetical protein|nr:hypothetical protein [Acetobacteraceae bacterium]
MSGGAAPLTVLGVAPVAAAARLALLFGEGGGPAVTVRRDGPIAAFAAHGAAWRQHRAHLRAALARAASTSPFLPADPRHASCTAADWPRIMSASAPMLAAALARAGGLQQWDVAITSSEAGGSPARVATLLRQGLGEEALAVRIRGRRGGLVVSCLLERGHGASLGAALRALPLAARCGASVSVEGPLPPLGFASFRLERARQEEVSRAWALFALKEVADPAELARRWRGLAFALDPARAGRRGSARPLREAARAYGLLQHLSLGLGQDRFARSDLLSLCGAPLALPEEAMWGHA